MVFPPQGAIPPTGVGVESLNGLSGVLTLSSVGSLNISASGTTITADLNLGHANTWAALQTFGTNISFLGAQVSGVLASGNLLYYNGTNLIGQSLSAGAGISVTGTTIANTGALSVANSDGTLTISPTTGAVVVSLNLGHANTWAALQTLSAGMTVSAGTLTFAVVPQTSQDTFASNTGYGTGALNVNTGSNGNAAFGYQALTANTTGTNNSAFGFQALLSNTTASSNAAFGYQALTLNTTGGDNSAFGWGALASNTTGTNNSAFGWEALSFNTTASSNAAFGFGALSANTTGGSNSAFGTGALATFNDTTSSSDYHVAIGLEAGGNYTGTERNNVVIGYNKGVAGESNMIRLGNAASGVTGQGQVAFSQIGLVGFGLAPIYGSAQGVSIATAATIIATYTPTATGTFRVVVTVECKVAANLDTLTVSYTGAATALVMTQTLTPVISLTAGEAVSYVALCYATTATAIDVTASASAASDLFGTATIEQMA